MRRQQFILGLCLGLLFAPAQAVPVSFFFQNHWAEFAHYNADTNLFTYDVRVYEATITRPGVVQPIVDRDVFGWWTQSVLVDESGITHGGAFILGGESTTLGIFTPAILLSGSIVSIDYLGGATPLLVSRGNVDFVAPQFEALFGPIDTIEVEARLLVSSNLFWDSCEAGVPCPDPSGAWASSVFFTPQAFSPSITGFPQRISEPPAMLLLLTAGLAAACIGRLRQRGRRRRTTQHSSRAVL